MSSGRRLMERIESGLGQGVGFAFAAILTAPLPVVMMAAGALAYSDARLQADRERVDLLLLRMEAGQGDGDWGVTASGLLQVQRALEADWRDSGGADLTVPPLPDPVAAWWTRFLKGAAEHGGEDQTVTYPACRTGREGRRRAGTWTDCVRSDIPATGSAANHVTFFMTPPVAFEPFTDPGVERAIVAHERSLFNTFSESLVGLLSGGDEGQASQVAQAYFVGASGTVSFWSRERTWVERAAADLPYDFRAADYFYRTRAAWRKGRESGRVEPNSNPLRFSPPAEYPPAVTFRSRRYVDYIGAGVVWTACLAVVSVAAPRTEGGDPHPWSQDSPGPQARSSPRGGDFLGALCADIADAGSAIRRLGAVSTPETAGGEPAPDTPERRLSSWWRTGVLVYRPNSEGTSEFRFDDADVDRAEVRRADLIAAVKPAVAERQDKVLRVPPREDVHADGFLLPAGIHGEEHTYLYLEFPSGVPPGVTEIIGGLVMLALPGTVWFVGARRRAAAAQRALDALTVDQLQVGVVRTDARGRVVFANDRAEEILGIPLARVSREAPPAFDALFDPIVFLADDFGAAWATGQRPGRITTMAEVNQHRIEGRSSRYFARLSEGVLSRVDAPRFSKHPYWCPWIEISGSPRLDGAGPRAGGDEQVEAYGVLRPVSPESGWDVLEPLWLKARASREVKP